MKIHSKPERDSVVGAAEAVYLRAKFLEGLMRGGEPLPRDVVFQDTSRENVRGSTFRLDGFFVTERVYVPAQSCKIRGFIEVAWSDPDFVVWAMQYNGYYTSEAAMTFAQSVLHETYRHGSFRCGRGPEKHADQEKKAVYFNLILSGSGKFAEPFSFNEEVQTIGPNPEVFLQIQGGGECQI